MEGSTVEDDNSDPMLGRWDAPMVSGEDILMVPKGVPNMVETTALIDDTVGRDETSEPRTCDGVTISEVRLGLAL